MYDSPVGDFDPNHVRVLVVGPMAAGKTTLVHSLCHGHGGAAGASALRTPAPTVGCNVDVKLLPGRHVRRSVEFWDVGGNPDAALARGMFFEGSEAAGVLLVYDVSNPRSLRELRAWADELVSSGLQIQRRSNSLRDGRDGLSPADDDLQGNNTALYAREGHGRREALGDLEGGARGAVTPTTGMDGVPVLVVGTKEDMGEGCRREGVEFATELGAEHIAVCAKGLGDEEAFDNFFGDVFWHHSGHHTSGDGGAQEWGAERQAGNTAYFPQSTYEVNAKDRSDADRDHLPGRAGGRSPGHTAQARGSMVNRSWGRAGRAGISEMESIRGDPSGSIGGRDTPAVEGAGMELRRPLPHGVMTTFASAKAAVGVGRPREKQS